jgi:hypothetical protein
VRYCAEIYFKGPEKSKGVIKKRQKKEKRKYLTIKDTIETEEVKRQDIDNSKSLSCEEVGCLLEFFEVR